MRQLRKYETLNDPADDWAYLAPARARHVLSDWQLSAQPPRADVLRLHADGRIERLSPAQAAAAR